MRVALAIALSLLAGHLTTTAIAKAAHDARVAQEWRD